MCHLKAKFNITSILKITLELEDFKVKEKDAQIDSGHLLHLFF